MHMNNWIYFGDWVIKKYLVYLKEDINKSFESKILILEDLFIILTIFLQNYFKIVNLRFLNFRPILKIWKYRIENTYHLWIFIFLLRSIVRAYWFFWIPVFRIILHLVWYNFHKFQILSKERVTPIFWAQSLVGPSGM